MVNEKEKGRHAEKKDESIGQTGPHPSARQEEQGSRTVDTSVRGGGFDKQEQRQETQPKSPNRK